MYPSRYVSREMVDPSPRLTSPVRSVSSSSPLSCRKGEPLGMAFPPISRRSDEGGSEGEESGTSDGDSEAARLGDDDVDGVGEFERVRLSLCS